MFKVNRLTASALLSLTLFAASAFASPTFFEARSKQERCAILTTWTEPLVARAYSSTFGPSEFISASQFRDAVFRPAFGKGYWDLTPDERKEIAKALKSCFKDWRATQLARPFAEEGPPPNWANAISRLQPASGLSTSAGRSTVSGNSQRTLRDSRSPEKTYDWPTLGLRVVVRRVAFSDRRVLLPYILAVREKSPAYFANLQPGDVITFMKCGSWRYSFIDQDRTYTSQLTNYSTADPADSPGDVESRVPQLCRAGLIALFGVAVPATDERKMKTYIEARTTDDVDGVWLSDKRALVIGKQQAVDDMKARFEELRQRAHGDLRNSPCKYDISNPYNLKAMPPIIREIAEARMAAGLGEENLLYWRDVIATYCDEARNGRLPSFESALTLISKGFLDPCAYDAKIDYSAIPESSDKQQRRYSRTEYENYISFSYFLGKISTEAQRECFYDIVRAQLTGKTWVPRTPSRPPSRQ